jgi:hypothetical protein
MFVRHALEKGHVHILRWFRSLYGPGTERGELPQWYKGLERAIDVCTKGEGEKRGRK